MHSTLLQHHSLCKDYAAHNHAVRCYKLQLYNKLNVGAMIMSRVPEWCYFLVPIQF